MERLSLWELCKGNLEGGLLYWKLGLIRTQRQAQKLISGLSPPVKTRPLSCNRTQSRVITDLLIGHNTLRIYFYLMGLTDSPLCTRCEAEEETSAHLEFQRVKYLGGGDLVSMLFHPLCVPFLHFWLSCLLLSLSLSLSLSLTFLIFEYQ
jgi:hypothetical protein